MKLKGNVHTTVALLCGAGTLATTSRHEAVNEQRILIWMCGMTRRENIRIEHIRGTTRMTSASKKLQKKRLHIPLLQKERLLKIVYCGVSVGIFLSKCHVFTVATMLLRYRWHGNINYTL